MMVRIGDSASVTLDLPVSALTWRAAASGELPRATLRIPRGGPAWEPTVLNPEGGSWVEIHAGPHGVWRGVTDVPRPEGNGAVVDCFHVSQVLAIRTVPDRVTLIGLTAGAIARLCASRALGPLAVMAIPLGTFVEAGPSIPEFALRGQSLLDVLRELHEITGQEWSLDPRTGRLSWVAREGRPREERTLLDLRGLVNPPQASLADVAREVTEVLPDGTSYTVIAPDVSPRWPRAVTERV